MKTQVVVLWCLAVGHVSSLAFEKPSVNRKDNGTEEEAPQSGLPNHFMVNGVDDVHYKRIDYHKGAATKQAKIEYESLHPRRKLKENKKKKKGGRKSRSELVERRKRLTKTFGLWPKGIVIYQFGTITQLSRDVFLEAVEIIEAETCIRFYEYTSTIHADQGLSHNSRLNVFNGNGCYSYIGFTGYTLQDLSPCSSINVAIHEVMHALGAYHEQSDFNRDQYIEILTDNIDPNRIGNFLIPSSSQSNFVQGVPFNLQSEMHYNNFGFSSEGLLTIRPFREDVVGDQANIWYNVKEINLAYGCYAENGCPNPPPSCSNEGYPGVKNYVCQCICPEGFDSASGCTLHDSNFDCGEVITLDSTNTQQIFSTPAFPSAMPSNYVCLWIIQTTGDDKIAVNLDETIPGSFSGGCQATMTIKRDLLGHDGVEYCGEGFQKTVLSTGNSVVIKVDSKASTGAKLEATATLLPESERCYSEADRGASYNGAMDRASDFDNSPCLNWADTLGCRYSPFNYPSNGVDLSGNQCRNVGSVLEQPWCYTAISGGSCTIRYCDACADGAVYDSYDNCDDLDNNDPLFCTSTEGISYCMQTCGVSYPNIVSGSDCGTPGDVSGATLTTPTSTTVGSTATYTCDSDPSITAQRTCLSTGLWSDLDNVCSDAATTTSCPSGYTQNGAFCYRGYSIRGTKSEGEARCANDGAILSPVESVDEQNFIASLINQMAPGYFFYLGGEKQSGVWRWEYNGANIFNGFNFWYYISRRSSRTCMVMLHSGYSNGWYNVPCGRRYRAVCRIVASITGSGGTCDDQRPDCQSMLGSIPQLCSTEWATVCSQTCGNCGSNDITCSVSSPAGSSNANLQSSGTLLPGNVALYTCTGSNVLLSGNLMRACQIDGTLTGTEPVCAAESSTTSLLNNMDLEELWWLMPKNFIAAGSSPQTTFTRSGKITTLIAYCVGEGDLIFYVLSGLTVQDSYTVHCYRSRVMSWDIPANDQMTVNPGNTLAVQTLSSNVLSMTQCSSPSSDIYYTYVGQQLSIGTTLNPPSSPRCLATPINAVIGPL